jgi:hypothetical protein
MKVRPLKRQHSSMLLMPGAYPKSLIDIPGSESSFSSQPSTLSTDTDNSSQADITAVDRHISRTMAFKEQLLREKRRNDVLIEMRRAVIQAEEFAAANPEIWPTNRSEESVKGIPRHDSPEFMQEMKQIYARERVELSKLSAEQLARREWLRRYPLHYRRILREQENVHLEQEEQSGK